MSRIRVEVGRVAFDWFGLGRTVVEGEAVDEMAVPPKHSSSKVPQVRNTESANDPDMRRGSYSI